MKTFENNSSKKTLWFAAMAAFALVTLTGSATLVAKKQETTIGKEAPTMTWSPEIIKKIRSGDPKKGEIIATKLKCQKCHGKDGISDENDTPNIAGLSRAYAFKQLFDYKYGRRKDKVMRRRCEKVTDQDLADMAAWYETMKMEPMMGVAASKTVPVLVNKGDMKRLLLPCETCHNAKGEGRGQLVPSIGGQKREHFIDTMTAYKEADRKNDDYGVMRFIAERLSDDEIEQLALYYGSKPLEEED